MAAARGAIALQLPGCPDAYQIALSIEQAATRSTSTGMIARPTSLDRWIWLGISEEWRRGLTLLLGLRAGPRYAQ